MPLTPSERQDRFHAAFVGLAIGDALGFPLRGIPPASLARLPGLAEDFAPRPRGKFAKGQFSDDTQLLLASAESVIREGRVDGRSAAAHLAWLWQEGIILQPPRSLAESLQRLSSGVPWMSAGAPLGTLCPSVLSRALVVGLFESGQRAKLPHDAGVLTVITHKDPVCAAAAAAFAQAAALGMEEEPLTPTAFCEQLSLAAAVHDKGLAEEVRHLPRLLTWDTTRALSQLRKVGVPPSELKGVDGLPAHVVPVLLTALYATLRVPHDFREAVALVLRCGGEADVAAALTGALVGAHLGTRAIPARLRKAVLYVDNLVDTADRLFRAHQVRETLATALAHQRRR
ncbi:ADP-ribosylglycohydrolase family protein [Myxococcus faecalis]|jgi:ADP-ribosylglycohydrolase|uniref:ADP-ribosylglycohydrolase family protein n=1 Tax=Myxococcus TaxID=32 RepID=UPI001CBFAC66|nr:MULTISPECIES: ADP-ribosylglycohydrolase family protein [unclassified Myxococcus]MBZ4396584.1 ADP-ribosylglycohydrolase family protein [Myxococcus sp. AS-1-15]MBZ4411708.1 ADP-ribosylglycohydrolase family protein [Myxococcus sp. XM-1-1-1]BDT38100.1 ADP-ribosylglycohydrolase family protein [Myxococcus sp. MH1]